MGTRGRTPTWVAWSCPGISWGSGHALAPCCLEEAAMHALSEESGFGSLLAGRAHTTAQGSSARQLCLFATGSVPPTTHMRLCGLQDSNPPDTVIQAALSAPSVVTGAPAHAAPWLSLPCPGSEPVVPPLSPGAFLWREILGPKGWVLRLTPPAWSAQTPAFGNIYCRGN